MEGKEVVSALVPWRRQKMSMSRLKTICSGKDSPITVTYREDIHKMSSLQLGVREGPLQRTSHRRVTSGLRTASSNVALSTIPESDGRQLGLSDLSLADVTSRSGSLKKLLLGMFNPFWEAPDMPIIVTASQEMTLLYHESFILSFLLA